MFQVRCKNSDTIYKVYDIMAGVVIEFLVFDKASQQWMYLLADNCVPADL